MTDPITCPGQFMYWSAFGATYSDTICATACTWDDGAFPGTYLCDMDDDCRPRGDVPCPFCAPDSFDEWCDEPGAAARIRAIETAGAS